MTKYDPIKDLKAALTDKLHIDLRQNPIRCWMEDDSIVIEGVVDSIALKKRALFFAMGLKGSSGIVDRLRVRPSMRMSDGEIKKHMYDALAEETTLAGSGIKVEVTDGVVDLEGVVGSLSHKRFAGVLAWWIPGSMDVINSLEVSPSQPDTGDDINEILRIALEKDRLVNPGTITVSTQDYVVTLNGITCSEDEKQAAEDDAWYIWGVNDVINNLRVEPQSFGVHHIP